MNDKVDFCVPWLGSRANKEPLCKARRKVYFVSFGSFLHLRKTLSKQKARVGGWGEWAFGPVAETAIFCIRVPRFGTASGF